MKTNKEKLAEAIAVMFLAKNQTINPATLEVWVELISKKINIDEALAACDYFANSEEAFITVGKIVNWKRTSLESNTDMEADESWQNVQHTIFNGRGRISDFERKVMHSVFITDYDLKIANEFQYREHEKKYKTAYRLMSIGQPEKIKIETNPAWDAVDYDPIASTDPIAEDDLMQQPMIPARYEVSL